MVTKYLQYWPLSKLHVHELNIMWVLWNRALVRIMYDELHVSVWLCINNEVFQFEIENLLRVIFNLFNAWHHVNII